MFFFQYNNYNLKLQIKKFTFFKKKFKIYCLFIVCIFIEKFFIDNKFLKYQVLINLKF